MANNNYTGRKIDLSIFIGAKAAGEQQLVLDFTPGGDVITGVEKMIQTFVYLFLTEQGSVKYYPSLGTPFVTAMKQGAINNENDVQREFDLAVELIRQTMDLGADESSLPPDETFDSASLLSFDLDKGSSKLTMQIKVTSQAGSTREIFLPIPVAIQ